MKLGTVLQQKNTGVLVAVLALVILVPFGYSIVRSVFLGTESRQVFLVRPDEQYKECVRETTYMRFSHMDLLKQTREEVIREGIRGEITLSGCRKCHTSRAQFCNKCHEVASLSVDCFGCHYYPEPGSESP
ncbi:MAG: hypothetical protein GTO22_26025 [Gemmatimonadales bacterium]|nr:hypothetical protein [Gemmatimonadales bacterium]